MQDFRNLAVWDKAHGLTLRVYEITRAFPKEELYGITSQMRRAAASIPTNIAEGCGRGGDKDFGRFLQMASGSACELDYLLLLSRDLGFLDPAVHDPMAQQVDEVRRMLIAFIQKLHSDK